MQRRGRPEESSVSLEYLTQIHDSYEKWLVTCDPSSLPAPVLVVDVNNDLNTVKVNVRPRKYCKYSQHSIAKCDCRLTSLENSFFKYKSAIQFSLILHADKTETLHFLFCIISFKVDVGV